jgi:hypothetical protein
MTYIADFLYKDGDTWVVEDVKGMKTRDYRLKKKMFLWTRWYPAANCFIFKIEMQDKYDQEKFIFKES